MKNLLINGDFGRWTATDPTVSASTGSTVAITDGWAYKQIAATGTQPSVTIGYTDVYPGAMQTAGYPVRTLTITPDGIGDSLPAGSTSALVQNLATPRDLSAREVVLSFWARADIPHRKIGVRVVQSYGTGADSADEVLIKTPVHIGAKWDTAYYSTWQQYVVRLVLPDYNDRSFGDPGTDALQVEFYLQSGSTLFSPAIQWAGEVDFTAVQLEAGSIPTLFEHTGVQLEVVDVPETATSPGRPGQIAFNASYVYICPADKTWVRASLASFP